ncbi:MAG: sulfatase-like hydrolase/transferase [Pseudomonadota bacterium]
MTVTRRQFLKTAGAASAVPLAGNPAATFAADPGWRARDTGGKPDIVMVVLDDVGFADLGCYGAEHRTPHIDALADGGTRFNNFHVTALCAPTRACLLTGRNAHAAGVGNIAEWGRDHPGYRGWIRQDALTLAEMLGARDYVSLATGKWHLTALREQNASGPFGQWPTGRGFDRWYGFHGNAMDHWHPEMFENTVAAYPEKPADYHLSSDLVDRSIDYVADHLTSSPERPYFLYLAFGAMHFPLHAPAADIDRYRGDYDQGWDKIRAERFARQQALGIVPPGTRLAPRNDNVPAWSKLTSNQRRLVTRGQEAYAGFLEHTDRQLGRLIDFLKRQGRWENTLMLVLSDNGAAYGGPIEGRLDVRRDAYLGKAPEAEFLRDLDLFGTEKSYGSYSTGWAQASNTPLKWYKSNTYEGGIRSPLIVSWPAARLPAGGINSQYHHAIDVAPTLFSMIGETPPDAFRGQAPLPMQGESFAYTFDQPTAETTKTTQYYETLGDRAIWHRGWKAVARHENGADFASDTWALYHAAEDFSEFEDLAQKYPDRLAELKALWQAEAERYDVLPMSDDTLTLYQNAVPAPRATYVFFPGMTRLDRLSAPDIYSYPSLLRAEVTLSSNRASGVLLTAGDSSCGYEWLLEDGAMVFGYVYTRNDVFVAKTRARVPVGDQTLELKISKTGEASAEAELRIAGKVAATLQLPRMWPIYAPNSGLRCGENRHAPVLASYQSPGVFEGTLHRIVVDVDMPGA